jgi:hypothetical protein
MHDRCTWVSSSCIKREIHNDEKHLTILQTTISMASMRNEMRFRAGLASSWIEYRANARAGVGCGSRRGNGRGSERRRDPELVSRDDRGNSLFHTGLRLRRILVRRSMDTRNGIGGFWCVSSWNQSFNHCNRSIHIILIE